MTFSFDKSTVRTGFVDDLVLKATTNELNIRVLYGCPFCPHAETLLSSFFFVFFVFM